MTLRTALTRREVANNVDSRHTADNTWVICAACHQAKTCIENSSHICVKHRWKMTWIGRSKDGQWHLPHLEEQADINCGWCLRCKLIAASYLIRPRQILSWEKSGADSSSTILLDALRLYELVNDQHSAIKLRPLLLERTCCPSCGSFLRTWALLDGHLKSEHPDMGYCLCRWCGKVFPDRTRLEGHMGSKKAHPNVCRHCDHNYFDLSRHIKMSKHLRNTSGVQGSPR